MRQDCLSKLQLVVARVRAKADGTDAKSWVQGFGHARSSSWEGHEALWWDYSLMN